MANWCSNRLIVQGTNEELAAFQAAACGPERPDFIPSEEEARQILASLSAHDRISLVEEAQARRTQLLAEAVLPEDALSHERMIAHLWQSQTIADIEAADGRERESIMLNFHRIIPVPLKDQINEPKTYSWTTALWGTRGMVENGDLEIDDETPGQLAYSFATAWSPPLEIVHKLIETLPTIRIALLYTEPGYDFCGAVWSTGDGDHDEIQARPSDFAQQTDSTDATPGNDTGGDHAASDNTTSDAGEDPDEDPDWDDDQEFMSDAEVMDILYDEHVRHLHG